LPGPPGDEVGELIQIALDLSGSLDPREVIARVLERGVRAVQADRGTLSSLVGDDIVIEATYGRAGALTWVGQRYSRQYFAGQPVVQRAIDSLQLAEGASPILVKVRRPRIAAAISPQLVQGHINQGHLSPPVGGYYRVPRDVPSSA